MSLPNPAWLSVKDDGTNWSEHGGTVASGNNPATAAPGYILVPAEHASKDSDLLTVDAGAVREKTDPELLVERLPGRLADVDAQTGILIAQGFVVQGQTLSLSERAQARLETLRTRATAGDTLPDELRWPKADNSGSVVVWTGGVNAVAGKALYEAAMDRRDSVVAEGVTLKDALNAATTVAELALVVDARI